SVSTSVASRDSCDCNPFGSFAYDPEYVRSSEPSSSPADARPTRPSPSPATMTGCCAPATRTIGCASSTWYACTGWYGTPWSSRRAASSSIGAIGEGWFTPAGPKPGGGASPGLDCSNGMTSYGGATP